MLFFVAENKRTCVFEKRESECVHACVCECYVEMKRESVCESESVRVCSR